MKKKIYLSESQFKDFMRKQIKEDIGYDDDVRFLDIDEQDQLLHAMIDNDFLVYFSNGRVYNCNYTHVKGDILHAVCSNNPQVLKNGRLRCRNDEYGYFEIDNLINAE
jgi:hypothetical protein